MISPIAHFHIFCGLGGGARGFNQGQARVGSLQARFICLGGIDSDPAAIADFERLAGVPGTCLDLDSKPGFLGLPHDQARTFAARVRGCIPQIAQALASGLQDMDQRRVNEEGAVQ